MDAGRLLSHDLPRSRIVAVALVLVAAGLLAAPFVFPGARALAVAAKIAIFIALAASYDLVLGYTGIVSFAHTMFFGIGAYGVAIASTMFGAGWASLAGGIAVALALSLLLALLLGLFGLRIKAVYYAMITLAVAAAFQGLASQLSDFTGGEDGLTFRLPALVSPSFHPGDLAIAGTALDGRLLLYYVILIAAALLFAALLRIVNSPFGRALQAIRENDLRAEAIGLPTVTYRTWSTVLGALVATLAGVLLSLWLRYSGPDTSLSLEVMLDVLVIVVIGGMGSLYGAVIGAALFLVAQNYLQAVLALLAHATAAVPGASLLLSPDRWLLWLGVSFVACVYVFPDGIVGRLRQRNRQ
jgi:branched-chain amino acid transport system permease protein